VGFVEKLGAKTRRIASLYVGRREGDRLLYAGKVRSGYTAPVAPDLRERLDPFIRKESPLSEPVKKPKATWVEPVIEAEVAYSALTENNPLRAKPYPEHRRRAQRQGDRAGCRGAPRPRGADRRRHRAQAHRGRGRGVSTEAGCASRTWMRRSWHRVAAARRVRRGNRS
jgi:bifunctional non-homologous end joining protein LigD